MAADTTTLDIGTAPYVALTYQRPLTLDTAKASLTKRASPAAPAIPIPSNAWAFADCTKSGFPGTPDPSKICVKGGFDPAFQYELVFTAKDPLVLGIGFAATRDLNSFLRYADKDDTGAANPVAQADPMGALAGQFAIGQFYPDLYSSGLQPGRGRADCVGRRESAYRRAAACAELPFRGGRRRGGSV